jgi:DNA anti-recombination protein RmuC
MSPVEVPSNGSAMEAGGPVEEPKSRSASEPAGNVEKIRDILFGSQMREYEHRFVRLEETLLKESADLRETTRKRFDALESFIRREFEALEGRLKGERDERASLGEALARRIGDMHDQTSTALRDMRGSALQQTKDLSDEIERRHLEMAATLEKRFQELRKDKTDRAALAALFTEVAMRLTDEFQVPSVDA